jgi:Asp-tRNA(Asn)/Glu-tRNA(Gln) amidotransferase B subunit
MKTETHTNELHQYYKTDADLKRLSLFPELVQGIEKAKAAKIADIIDTCRHVGLNKEDTQKIIDETGLVNYFIDLLNKVKEIESTN